jgi:hypothetical protein
VWFPTFALGVAIQGAQAGLNALAASFYPYDGALESAGARSGFFSPEWFRRCASIAILGSNRLLYAGDLDTERA